MRAVAAHLIFRVVSQRDLMILKSVVENFFSSIAVPTPKHGNEIPTSLCRNFISTLLHGNRIPTKWHGNGIPTNHSSELYTIYNPASWTKTV